MKENGQYNTRSRPGHYTISVTTKKSQIQYITPKANEQKFFND